MTTPILPTFKEEPGLNALKIGKKQVVRNVDIAFDEIQKKPKTLAGYGITDAVLKKFFDEKIIELLGKITELEQKNREYEQKYTTLEARVSTLEQKS